MELQEQDLRVTRFLPDNKQFRQQVLAFEKVLGEQEGAVFNDSDLCPLKHTFTDGAYAREIFIPAGVCIVGKIHRHEHLNFLMQGEVVVVTENGKQHLKAPLMMVSAPGTKRVVYALTNVVWTTIHITTKRDLKEIEEEIIAPNYESIGRITQDDVQKIGDAI